MPRQKKSANEVTRMRLSESDRQLAAIVGNGNRTAGVERLFAQLPTFYRVKLLLRMLVEDPRVPARHRRRAEAELLAMEELEIDRIYGEAIAEGAIVVKGADGESTAWIV